MFFAGLILSLLFFIATVIPCAAVAILGVRMMNRLAHFPSKTPAIQLSIVWKLVVIEVIGFTMFMLLYHMFADYGEELKREKMQFIEQGR